MTFICSLLNQPTIFSLVNLLTTSEKEFDMRCKCCDSQNQVQFWKDEWYCYKCRTAIRATIKDDKLIYDKWRDEDAF